MYLFISCVLSQIIFNGPLALNESHDLLYSHDNLINIVT